MTKPDDAAFAVGGRTDMKQFLVIFFVVFWSSLSGVAAAQDDNIAQLKAQLKVAQQISKATLAESEELRQRLAAALQEVEISNANHGDIEAALEQQKSLVETSTAETARLSSELKKSRNEIARLAASSEAWESSSAWLAEQLSLALDGTRLFNVLGVSVSLHAA